jgi:hypothetical protein
VAPSQLAVAKPHLNVRREKAGCRLCAVALSAIAPSAQQKPTFGAWGVDLAGMDTSVKPGDDFFD